MDLYSYAKKDIYFIYLKEYLMGLWAFLGITLGKLHWFVTLIDVYPYAKKPT